MITRANPRISKPARSIKSLTEPSPVAFRIPLMKPLAMLEGDRLPMPGIVPSPGIVIPAVVAVGEPPEEPLPADCGHFPPLIQFCTVVALATRELYCAPPGWHPTHFSKLAAKLPAASAMVLPDAEANAPCDFNRFICAAMSAEGFPVTRYP